MRAQTSTANQKQLDNLRLISANINMKIGSFRHFSEFSFVLILLCSEMTF